MTETITRNAISLAGSAQLVQEFFYFGINSILYQRGLYPADSFKREHRYGLSLLVTNEDKLTKFLEPLLKQIEYWLSKKKLKRLEVIISTVQTKEALEKWQFDIATDNDITESGDKSTRNKCEKKIRQEMSDVIRQITASVTFLPLLEQECSFDVLIYTCKDAEAPDDWTESEACIIHGAQEVPLRSFSTDVHTVSTKVTYKTDDD